MRRYNCFSRKNLLSNKLSNEGVEIVVHEQIAFNNNSQALENKSTGNGYTLLCKEEKSDQEGKHTQRCAERSNALTNRA